MFFINKKIGRVFSGRRSSSGGRDPDCGAMIWRIELGPELLLLLLNWVD
jgi:hypothetical protein